MHSGPLIQLFICIEIGLVSTVLKYKILKSNFPTYNNLDIILSLLLLTWVIASLYAHMLNTITERSVILQ